jgi:hypothetical protein
MKLVRVGLAAVIVGGAFGVISAAGCSGDDNNGGGGHDSGTDHSATPDGSSSGGDTGPGPETGTNDTGSDGEGGTTNYAKVFLVHAAVDPLAPPLRFCFGVDNSGNGSAVTVAGKIPPFPDYKVSPLAPVAGLPPGFGGSTATSPTLKAFDLAALPIALYAVNAIKIANDTADGGPDGGAEVPCENLIGSDAKGSVDGGTGTLALGTDYWYLGSIPKGTLAHGTTWVAAVAGCAPGESGTAAALCGASYNATTGNLKLVPYQLDNTTVVAADAGIGAQFAQASSQWDGVVLGSLGGAGTVAGFLLPNATTSDAGADAAPASPYTPFPITGATPAKDDGNLYPTKLATVHGATFDTNTLFFAESVAADGGTSFVPPGCTPGVSCAGILPMSTIAALSGSTFANGQGYVFMLVGDPNEAPFTDDAGTFNGKFVHFLAFPTSNP